MGRGRREHPGAYESVLARFTLDHADLDLLDFEPVGTERLVEFLDRH